jgi:hypothetical protein
MDPLFWLYVERGDIKVEQKQYDQGRQDFDRAKVIARREQTQKTADAQYDAAVAEERLGSVDHFEANSEKDPKKQQDKLQTALGQHGTALKMFQEMKAARGEDPAVVSFIGLEEQNLGWDLSALGQPDIM